MTRPPFGERRAHQIEPLDQLPQNAHRQHEAQVGAESGERVLAPRAPVDEQGAQR